MTGDPFIRGESRACFIVDGVKLEATGELEVNPAPWKTEYGWDVGTKGTDLLAVRTGGFVVQNVADDSFVKNLMEHHESGGPGLFHRPEIELSIENTVPARPPIPAHDVSSIPWRRMPVHLWSILRRAFAEAAGTASGGSTTKFVFSGLQLQEVPHPKLWSLDENGEIRKPETQLIELRTRW